jgi:hypothetical protein
MHAAVQGRTKLLRDILEWNPRMEPAKHDVLIEQSWRIDCSSSYKLDLSVRARDCAAPAVVGEGSMIGYVRARMRVTGSHERPKRP